MPPPPDEQHPRNGARSAVEGASSRRGAPDAWLAQEARGTPFQAQGEWGSLGGTVTMTGAGSRSGTGLGRLFGARAARAPLLALVAPQAPGLENAARMAMVDDAISTGLLREGVHVARVRDLTLTTSPLEDANGYTQAIAAALDAALALAPGARPALAGSWLAGAAMAVAGAEREDMTCMVLVSAPVPEVMCRRTPENEDDPVWQTSAALRLADTLSAIAPLEMITQGRRPVLLVHGAVDDELPVTHLEAWRSALAFTGKPVETIEIAFADALFQPIDADGHVDAEDPWALDLLADVISRWTGRILAGR